MTYTIGLTGGIGSGKSTVAKLFSELGAPVFDTDLISRYLVEPGQAAFDELVNLFGKDILNENGSLDRQKLKDIVFSDEKAKSSLEDMLHPRIQQELIAKINQSNSPYCVAVIPLLIEKQWENIVDRILVVDSPIEQQIERTQKRDGIQEQLIRSIIDSQTTREIRLAAADDIINNQGEIENLTTQVKNLHQKYSTLKT